MKKESLIVILVMIAIITVGVALSSKPDTEAKPVEAQLGRYDTFAKCLTQKGVKMYGAYWCGHCQDQKKAFGPSFGLIDYNECAVPDRIMQTTEVCKAAKVNQYPAWDFPGGVRKIGRLSLEELSELSGCQLPTLTAALNVGK